jgi:hypothetical protein
VLQPDWRLHLDVVATLHCHLFHLFWPFVSDRRLGQLNVLASDQGLLIAARIAQGVGATIMTPAALSILTTT